MKYILIASDNRAACDVVRDSLHSEYGVDVVRDRAACIERFQKRRYEFVFIDVDLLISEVDVEGHADYKKALQPFWQVSPTAQIIALAPQKEIREAVNMVKAGAVNYITYPINPEELKFVTESIYESMRAQSELNYLRDQFWNSDWVEIIRTHSQEMKKVYSKIRSVAPTKTTVLLLGETGTGKGVVAKLIHQHSNRRDKPFIAVHCGAIPETLIESELFGHEKGAFTGAVRRKLGKFEIARGGTIFLDEVSTITPSAQVKLLQVLQEKTFQRVGGEEDIVSDVRIITATNDDLKILSDSGAFRRDLYFRLNVFPIVIPPLGERRGDIPLLVDIILQRLNKLYSKNIYDVHPQLMEALVRYPWPGNVRELENLIERAYIIENSSILTPESFPGEFFDSGDHEAHISVDASLSLAEARRKWIASIEKRYLKEVLTLNRGKIKDTAKAAAISVRQLHKLMAKHGLRKEDFKAALIPEVISEP
jgi:DNA-binding NtrC family response regulator